MAEEHRCQSPPEGHRLCANNCGFFGSPGTLNLCSKCYRDFRLKEEQASSAKMAVEKSLLASSSASTATCPPSPVVPVIVDHNPLVVLDIAPATSPSPALNLPQQPSRCTTCRKRVGLMGFKCRCGATFCGHHRYPEQHECGFDFKSTGREAIARANPVVKAQKLDKI